MKTLFLTLAVAALTFTACESSKDLPQPSGELRIAALSVAGNNDNLTHVAAQTTYREMIERVAFTDAGFTMTLPLTLSPEVLDAMSLISVDFGDDDVNISDMDAMYLWIEFIGYNGNNSIGTLENQSGTTRIEYWYVDRNVTIKTPAGGGSVHFDTRLTQGWNKVLVKMDINGTSFTSPLSAKTDLGWIFFSY